MKRLIPLLKQLAVYYTSRKQQLISIICAMLVIAILLAIAVYLFVRLLFRDFDISLTEDVMNIVRATGLATLLVCILFSPCLLLEALVYFSEMKNRQQEVKEIYQPTV